MKTKGEIYIYEIISLVLFGQRFFNYKYRYNKRYDREKSSMNRAQSFYFDTVKKKILPKSLSSTSALRLYIGSMYFYAGRKRPVINFPKQKARRNRVPSSFHETEEKWKGGEKRRTKIIGTACTLVFQLRSLNRAAIFQSVAYRLSDASVPRR